MRVLHVVNDASTGGAQTLIEQLILEQRSSVQFHILVLLGPGPLSDRFAVSASGVTYLGLNRRSLRVDVLVRGTRRVIREFMPDIVHSHLLQADLAVAIGSLGIRTGTVSTIHTTGMTSADPLRSRVLGKFLGIVSRVLIDKSVACGSGAAVYMKDHGYSKSRAMVVNNGVRVSPEILLRPRSPRGTLLSLSRWHPMKDHENLFRAFKLAKRRGLVSELICAGAGLDGGNRELVASLEAHGITDSVRLLGPVGDVRTLIRAADALVISSSYGEALPMAGLEAIAEGTPVVTTNLGDCRRLAVDVRQCVPPKDSRALASAIEYVFSLPPEGYIKLCRDSHESALGNFSIGAAAVAYMDVYEGLASKTKGEF